MGDIDRRAIHSKDISQKDWDKTPATDWDKTRLVVGALVVSLAFVLVRSYDDYHWAFSAALVITSAIGSYYGWRNHQDAQRSWRWMASLAKSIRSRSDQPSGIISALPSPVCNVLTPFVIHNKQVVELQHHWIFQNLLGSIAILTFLMVDCTYFLAPNKNLAGVYIFVCVPLGAFIGVCVVGGVLWMVYVKNYDRVNAVLAKAIEKPRQ